MFSDRSDHPTSIYLKYTIRKEKNICMVGVLFVARVCGGGGTVCVWDVCGGTVCVRGGWGYDLCVGAQFVCGVCGEYSLCVGCVGGIVSVWSVLFM